VTRRPLGPRVGELRPSQFLHTFGVGQVIDLPHISAMVMGIEDWQTGYCMSISEERLLAEVRKRLGAQVERLATPPMAKEERGMTGAPDEEANGIGLPVAPFPRFLRCPACKLLSPLSANLFRLKTDPYRPDRARYVHGNCTRATDPIALPARFLLACDNGHLDDFPWHAYVHAGASGCVGHLYLEEHGVTGEAADVLVRCSGCGNKRPMVDAFGPEAPRALGRCRGRRPQLRDFEEETCGAPPPKTLLLGASNSWFAASLSVLSVPPAAPDRLARLVQDHWDSVLAKVKSPAVLEYLREEGKLGAFAEVDDAALWAAVEARRRAPAGAPSEDLKTPEWRAFAAIDASRNGVDFQLEEVAPPPRWKAWIPRVVLASRLREVTALLGFTRISSPRDFAGVDDLPGRIRAPLSRKPPTFAPAAEVRGEGIFLQFDEARLARWCDEQDDAERMFQRAHRAFRARRKILPPEAGFPGLRYALIHSFSHALMRQLALECGYAGASLRERVYADCGEGAAPAMAGVLIYTAAPDSEGTLGGLVRLGDKRELERHIERALASMRLCSSDPLCADHDPEEDRGTLHAAACHACLFAPETSCERGNKYLDRSLLVRTVRAPGGFFDAGGP
jgi:Domain of unknown function (DUF1998)